MRALPLRPAAIAAAALLALAACGGPANRQPADTAAPKVDAAGTTPAAGAAAAADAAAPTAAVVVLYNEPADTAAFEKYYRESHVPLVGQHAAEIGFTRAVLTKFDRTLDGKKAPYYRKAELWFPSAEALERGVATAGFKALGADFPRFVTNGGPTVLVSHETNK